MFYNYDYFTNVIKTNKVISFGYGKKEQWYEYIKFA